MVGLVIATGNQMSTEYNTGITVKLGKVRAKSRRKVVHVIVFTEYYICRQYLDTEPRSIFTNVNKKLNQE